MKVNSTNRRVVITGIGIVSPLGNTKDSTWAGILSGKSGITKITHFEADAFSSQIAG